MRGRRNIMKQFLLLVAAFVLCGSLLFSQSAKDQLESFAREENYTEAVKYIPDAIKENRKDLKLHLMAGEIYENLDMLEEALDMYLKADDIDSREPYIMRRVGKAYSLLGNHNEAMKWLYNAVKRDDKDVRSRLELGQALIRADSLDKAELVITKARSMDKDIADAWVALGDLYYAQRVYELAKNNYEEALSIDEDNIEARINLAQSYFQMAYREYDKDLSNELFTRSLNQWNEVSRRDPNNARAFRQQGQIYYMAKMYKEAAPSFYQYLKFRPDDIETRWKFARSLFETSNCDSAAPQLQIIMDDFDNDSIKSEAKIMLAKCLYDNEDFAGSVKLYQEIKEKDPLDDTQLKRLATAAFKIADSTTGINAYKELINQDTTQCSLMYSLGVLMLSKKDYDLAKYFLEKRLQYCQDTMDQKVLYFLGSCYANTDAPDIAKMYLLRSIGINPEYYSARVSLGDAYAALDSQDSALMQFNYIIDNAAKDSTNYGPLTQAYAKLAGVHLENGSYSSLQKVSKSWVDFDPKSEYAYLYLAVSYHGLKDTENACRYYRKVLSINPKNKNARDAISKMECP
jgi:tetratricopeptide (TPR) repeat protein